MTLSWLAGVDDGRILYTTVLESLVQLLMGKYVKSGFVVKGRRVVNGEWVMGYEDVGA